MNELIYYLLNKLHGEKKIDSNVLEKLYYYYTRSSNNVGTIIYVSRDEFDKVISVIYSVLRFRLDEREFVDVIINYLSLLVVDAKADNVVDIDWFIKYIWYLGTNCVNSAYLGYFSDIDVEKFSDCIPFIQKKLVSELNVRKTVREKLERKVYTRIMIK